MWRRRFLVLLALAFVSCTPGPGASSATGGAPSTAPKGVRSVEAMCDRLRVLSNGTESDRKNCLDKVSALRDNPPLYGCIDGCVDVSTTIDSLEACAARCESDHPKKKKPSDDESVAMNMLGYLETGSRNAWQSEVDQSDAGVGPFVHTFCPSSTQPVPKELPAAGQRVATSKSEWDAPTWRCLKFDLTEPTASQYAYESNGKIGKDATYRATARRRLANGKVHVIELIGAGSITGDSTRVSLRAYDE